MSGVVLFLLPAAHFFFFFLELCKWILRSQECFRLPLGLRACFSDPLGGSPCPMACEQLTLQTTFADRPRIPLEQPGPLGWSLAIPRMPAVAGSSFLCL